MKTLFFGLFFVFMADALYPWMAANEHGGVRFAKYLYCGYPVWSDKDKDEIISFAGTSSKTITTGDFTDIRLTVPQKKLIEARFPSGEWVDETYRQPFIKAEMIKEILIER